MINLYRFTPLSINKKYFYLKTWLNFKIIIAFFSVFMSKKPFFWFWEVAWFLKFFWYTKLIKVIFGVLNSREFHAAKVKKVYRLKNFFGVPNSHEFHAAKVEKVHHLQSVFFGVPNPREFHAAKVEKVHHLQSVFFWCTKSTWISRRKSKLKSPWKWSPLTVNFFYVNFSWFLFT